MSRPSVLLIERNTLQQIPCAAQLGNAGYQVHYAQSAREGMDLFLSTDSMIVLLDLALPDGDGPALLRKMLDTRPQTAIIVLSDGSFAQTSEAMHNGAVGFLLTPPTEEQLIAAIQSAQKITDQEKRKRVAPAHARPETGFVGQSQAIRDVYARIQSAAMTLAPALITGESGTGKELCARTIHTTGPRARARFVTLDCAATSPDQFEQELCGHIRGAFPAATADRPGLAMLANGGTLFLDEICELDLTAQSKLLRFMQTMLILPMGGSTPIPVNVRIIASSTASPTRLMAKGQLREDLFYALQVLSIRMPPLRERREDIIPLAKDLLVRYSEMEGRLFTGFDPAVEQVLCEQYWPGNVRQLMSILRAITILHKGPQVTLDMLPEDILIRLNDTSPRPQNPADKFYGMTLAEVERHAIEAAIKRNNGSVPRAAKDLAVAPSTIYRKVEAWKP